MRNTMRGPISISSMGTVEILPNAMQSYSDQRFHAACPLGRAEVPAGSQDSDIFSEDQRRAQSSVERARIHDAQCR